MASAIIKQCQATTRKGKQCSHRGLHKGFCYQHKLVATLVDKNAFQSNQSTLLDIFTVHMCPAAYVMLCSSVNNETYEHSLTSLEILGRLSEPGCFVKNGLVCVLKMYFDYFSKNGFDGQGIPDMKLLAIEHDQTHVYFYCNDKFSPGWAPQAELEAVARTGNLQLADYIIKRYCTDAFYFYFDDAIIYANRYGHTGFNEMLSGYKEMYGPDSYDSSCSDDESSSE
jgi:hypothetical protein